jgi:hypothetical protein
VRVSLVIEKCAALEAEKSISKIAARALASLIPLTSRSSSFWLRRASARVQSRLSERERERGGRDKIVRARMANETKEAELKEASHPLPAPLFFTPFDSAADAGLRASYLKRRKTRSC